MNTTLSIIVPVYNGANYIKDSVGSLLDQLTSELEVIVVNDGSLDETSQILRKEFFRHIESGHLKLIEQNNLGVSAARNHGLDQATGRYIGFVDSDDHVLPGYVQKILDYTRSGADIVEFGFRTFATSPDNARLGKVHYSNDRFGFHQTSDIANRVYGIARWYPWTRVFRASLFEGVRFPISVRFCEDLMTIPFLYEKSRTILSSQEALYGYRENPAGATFNIQPDYVPNLERFYSSIPSQRTTLNNYMRMAVAYAIHSCRKKAGESPDLPLNMVTDMRSLRYSPSVYRDINPRRIAMQLYPSSYQLAKRIARLFR